MSTPKDELDNLLNEGRALVGQKQPQTAALAQPDSIDSLLSEGRQLTSAKAPAAARQTQSPIQPRNTVPQPEASLQPGQPFTPRPTVPQPQASLQPGQPFTPRSVAPQPEASLQPGQIQPRRMVVPQPDASLQPGQQQQPTYDPLDNRAFQAGFSKDEIERYKVAYGGVHPAEDPQVSERAPNFLRALRYKDNIGGQPLQGDSLGAKFEQTIVATPSNRAYGSSVASDYVRNIAKGPQVQARSVIMPRSAPIQAPEAALDNVAAQAGFNKIDIEAYKQAYGVHPVQDPQASLRADRFLAKQREKDAIPGQTVSGGVTGALESTVSQSGAWQQYLANYSNYFNHATSGLAGTIELKPTPASDDPNMLMAVVKDALRPENVSAVLGDVTQLLALGGALKGLGGAAGLIGEGIQARAGLGAAPQELAQMLNQARRTLGAYEVGETATAAEKLGHTTTLFGAQSAIATPPEGSSRALQATIGGIGGAASGKLAGADPGLLREWAAYYGPQAAQTVARGAAEGKSIGDIAGELTPEAISNLGYVLGFKAGDLLKPRGEQLAGQDAPGEQPETSTATASRMSINKRVAGQQQPFRGFRQGGATEGGIGPRPDPVPEQPQPPEPQATPIFAQPFQPEPRIPSFESATPQDQTGIIKPRVPGFESATKTDYNKPVRASSRPQPPAAPVNSQPTQLPAPRIPEYHDIQQMSNEELVSHVPYLESLVNHEDPEVSSRAYEALTNVYDKAGKDEYGMNLPRRASVPGFGKAAGSLADPGTVQDLIDNFEKQPVMDKVIANINTLLEEGKSWQEIAQLVNDHPALQDYADHYNENPEFYDRLHETLKTPLPQIRSKADYDGDINRLQRQIDTAPDKETKLAFARQQAAVEQERNFHYNRGIEPEKTAEGGILQAPSSAAAKGEVNVRPKPVENATVEEPADNQATSPATGTARLAETAADEPTAPTDKPAGSGTGGSPTEQPPSAPEGLRPEEIKPKQSPDNIDTGDQFFQRSAAATAKESDETEPTRRVAGALSNAELPAKLRAVPGQPFSSEGKGIVKAAPSVVVGPNRARVAKQFAEHFKRPAEEIAATMTVGDAIASAWARREGKNPDEFYSRLTVATGKHPNPEYKGVTDFATFEKDGKAVIKALNNPDASTALHELGHVARRYLPEADQKILNNWVFENRGNRGFNKQAKWTDSAEEDFSRAFEKYLHEGNAPNNKLASVFEKIKGWMSDVYGSISDIIGLPKHPLNVKMTDDVRGVFDRMLGGGDVQRVNNEGRRVTADSNAASVDATADRGVQESVQKPAVSVGANEDGITSAVQPNGRNDAANVSTVTGNDSTAKPVGSKGRLPKLNPTGSTRERALVDSANAHLAPEAQLEPQEYNQLTNKDSFAAADKLIADNPQRAHAVATSSKIGPLQYATAIKLISKYQGEGDFARAKEVSQALATSATESGQAIQILSSISKVSPEGVVPFAERVVSKASNDTVNGQRAQKVAKQLTDAINGGEVPASAVQRLFQKAAGAPKDLARKMTEALSRATTPAEKNAIIRTYTNKHFKAADLSPEAAQELFEMAKKAEPLTGEERKIAVALMAKKIGEQMPSAGPGAKAGEFIKGVKLLGFGTTGRFVVRHLGFAASEAIADYPHALVDSVISKITGKREQYAPTAGDLQQMGRDLITGTVSAAKNAINGINPDASMAQQLRGPAMRSKVGKFINAVTGVTIRALPEGVIKAFEGQQMRNLARAGNITDPAKMQVEAGRRAAEVALQDSNWANKTLNRLREFLNFGQATGLGDAVILYSKAPGSSFVRGLEYTPPGALLKAAYELGRPHFSAEGAKEGFRQYDFARAIGRGITGTIGLMATGAALSAAGLIIDEPDDPRAKALARAEGRNGRQVNVSGLWRLAKGGDPSFQPGDKLYKYNWIEPMAFPFDMGHNFVQLAKGGDKTYMAAAKALLQSGVDTVRQDKLVTGLEQKLRAPDEEEGGVGAKAVSLGQEIPGLFVPAFIGEIQSLVDTKPRDTYSPNRNFNEVLQGMANKVMAQIPGLSSMLPEDPGVLGIPKERLGNLTTYNPTPETKYALDLYEKEGKHKTFFSESAPYLPAATPRTQPVTDEFTNTTDHILTPRERTEWAKTAGAQQKQVLSTAAQANAGQLISPRAQAAELEKGMSGIKEATKASVLGDRRPGYEKSEDKGVPQNPEIYTHNSKVTEAYQSTKSALETNENLRRRYHELTDPQKDHAQTDLKKMYDDLRVKDDPKQSPEDKQHLLDVKRESLKKETLYYIGEKMKDWASWQPEKR